MKRPTSTDDTGFSTTHTCGFESVSYLADRVDLRHDAECCDCQMVGAWWSNRIRLAGIRGQQQEFIFE